MKRVLRWIGFTLGGLIGLAVIAGCVLYVISGRKLARPHDVSTEQELAIPTDTASVARGGHIVRARPCGACHGEDLGGKVFADVPPFAVIAGPNLTSGRGGLTPPRTDVEWERAIRHGIRRGGTALIVMPSEEFHQITDDEMAVMIAYLKQLPPVDREVRTRIRLVGRLFLGAGQFKTAAELSPTTAHVASMDTTPSVDYGRYITSVSGCRGCHGESFSGRSSDSPTGKPASNLTPTGLGHYTEDDFKRVLRTGVRPGGGAALSEDMPWKFFGKMSDGELRAVWLFLQSLPPKQFGEK